MAGTDVPVPKLADRAEACANHLRRADGVLVASHIDADGLTSAAVTAIALERAGIPFDVVFEKQLDGEAVRQMASADYSTVVFTDFGSGQLDIINEYEAVGSFTPIVVDHHQPADADTEFHLNPLHVGIDGASELSGAGTAYVLARALATAESDHDNKDIAALAVVGAVGDMQASGGELVGTNRQIVREGIEAGVLSEGTDLALYGKQTRPLPKLLEYATDVYIPGVSGSATGSVKFLESLAVDIKADGEWRRWIDLTDDERQTVASALFRRATAHGVPAEKIESLVGTTYTLTGEPEGTELRDASEFSTLLNATARYERADVGLAVCLGDRGDGLERARQLLQTHRRNLSKGVRLVERQGVTRGEQIQWFDAGDRIRETIVGIVAGMALGSEGIDRSIPIIAFAKKSEAETKVSARGTPTLVRKGLDLSEVMNQAAQSVDGNGGGHDIAAGATIPAGQEETFVEHADRLVGDQLG